MMDKYYISRYMQILYDKNGEKYFSQMELRNTNGHATRHCNFRDLLLSQFTSETITRDIIRPIIIS